MKKNYLIIVFLLISGFSYGQYFQSHILNTSDDNTFQQHISKKSSKTQKLSNSKKLDSLSMDYYTGGTIIPYVKQYFTYTNAGNLAESIILENINQVLVPANKENYTYDASNRIIEHLSFKWKSSTNQWDKELKSVMTYASNSYETVIYTWHTPANQWVKSTKIENYQNQSLLDTLVLSYIWNNQWNLYSKTHYTYNSNNDLVIREKESKSGNNWVNNNKTEKVYDVNFNLLKTIDFIWNSQTNVYISSNNNKSGYDSQNNKVYDVSSFYNTSTSSWEYSDSTTYTYSSNANLDSSFNFNWNNNISSWKLEAKNLMTYDDNYVFSDLILPMAIFDDDDMMYFNHMLTKIKGKNLVNGQWNLSFIYDIYYSDFVATSIDQTERNTLKIAPNPTQDYFVVTLEGKQLIDIAIYDATGRLVKTLEANSDRKVNIRDLKSGIYFLQITDANMRVYSSKLIKR